ncbi:hypothetical protein PVAP13_1KG056185 [Panicum virgatum]|uniref:Uncharacterized protein n=1 Tax=Panicum virgatum TaxID=38727 RepID=A0A8T0XFP7_PANVG|nr:hypothetical protein PVAP13_1KG056185 [Panicum virgatum]
MRPLNRLFLRSSTAKDAELMQKEDGIHPWKLLLLASSTTRLFITFHVADGNSPVKRLLEMLSTCNGRPPVAEDGVSSPSSPSRRLKLTSTATKPLEEDRSFSNGSSPDSELRERLRRRSPARSPRAGETGPWSPLPGRETSTTAPSPSQATPSHEQHPAVALLRRHDVARPPSRDSPTTNRSRELLSWSAHGLAREAMNSTSSSTVRAKPEHAMADYSLLLVIVLAAAAAAALIAGN